MHKHTFLAAFDWLPASRQRALRRNLIFIGALLVLGLLSKAFAAGGSYVVDDGAINAPRRMQYRRRLHPLDIAHHPLRRLHIPRNAQPAMGRRPRG